MTRNVVAAPSDIGYSIWQEGAGTPLLMLHGFTGSHASWQHLVASLSQFHRVTTLDLPGHGLSGISSIKPWNFTSVVDDLAWLIDSRLDGAADVVGYSMGGRLALGMAISHPERVRNLILESASPGIQDDVERRARQHADEQLAERILTNGIEPFVSYWERLPMWVTQADLPASDRQCLQQIRLGQNSDGLAASLRAMGTGAQPSYWDDLAAVTMPTLLLAGELDTKFVHIANRMHEILPESQLEIVAGAGHAIHLEQPATYSLRVSQFLKQRALTITESEKE